MIFNLYRKKSICSWRYSHLPYLYVHQNKSKRDNQNPTSTDSIKKKTYQYPQIVLT
jgi:hypothetical protein